jgi:hypothetical protein
MAQQLLSLIVLAALSVNLAIPTLPDAPAADSAPIDISSADVSANWAGYIAQEAASYTAVGSSWTVPQPDPAEGRRIETDAAWVGIGGVEAEDLIQAGTQALTQDGDVVYQAWFETLPQAQEIIPLEIEAGDAVRVSLVETSPDVWHLSFVNVTTGDRYERDIPYESSRSSAEWIVERPAVRLSRGLAYLPLDDFGSVTFRGAYAIADGKGQSIESAHAAPVFLGSQDRILAYPGAVSGDTFSVARTDTEAPMASRTPQRFDFSDILITLITP